MSLLSYCYECRWCGKVAGDTSPIVSLPPRTHCPHCGCPIQRPLNHEFVYPVRADKCNPQPNGGTTDS